MIHVEALKAARALIEDPKRWTQGAYGRDAGGRKRGCGWNSDCVCWCAIGALEKVTHGVVPNSLSRFLIDSVRCSVADYNDDHTHAEVLAMFDKAIELASKGA